MSIHNNFIPTQSKFITIHADPKSIYNSQCFCHWLFFLVKNIFCIDLQVIKNKGHNAQRQSRGRRFSVENKESLEFVFLSFFLFFFSIWHKSNKVKVYLRFLYQMIFIVHWPVTENLPNKTGTLLQALAMEVNHLSKG